MATICVRFFSGVTPTLLPVAEFALLFSKVAYAVLAVCVRRCFLSSDVAKA